MDGLTEPIPKVDRVDTRSFVAPPTISTMPTSSPPRRPHLLPLALRSRAGRRAAARYHDRCDLAGAETASHGGDEDRRAEYRVDGHGGDVVAHSLSRRSMVKAGAVGGVLGGLSAWSVINAEESDAARAGQRRRS
jgi:hypothetical protein